MTRLLLLRIAAFLWVGILFAGTPAKAEDLRVDLELALAIDSSSSVDYGEFDLQVRGLAAAFRDPRVMAAIESGPLGKIAVTVIEWSSPEPQFQRVNLPWTLLDDAESIEAFAEDLDQMPRLQPGGGTAISRALYFAVRQFENNGFDGTRKVIDVSGDGEDNWQEPLEDARNHATAWGITINALAILNEAPDLDAYFRKRLIGGPGAFVITADDYEDFARAIREKLVREIGSPPIALADRPLSAGNAVGR
ncbi:MAG: DUF1194 domain-containing protein [Alphaproteobacteria bacterium]|nr:DUF1194 domain-containing protein [Alphaproteobacteria bacterium]